MNYCDPETKTAERCECYKYYDMFNEPKVEAICEVGQVCIATGTIATALKVQCVTACDEGQIGPCVNLDGPFGVNIITNSQVCLKPQPSDDYTLVYPIAALDVLLTTQSACLIDNGETKQWELCDAGKYCHKLTDKTAKCVIPCPIESIAPEQCLCVAASGANTLAETGKFCAASGAVSDFTGTTCKLASFGNGLCKCVIDGAVCSATSVCVSNSGTVQCMPACKLNAQNTSGADCACRGPKDAKIVPNYGKCVITNDGTTAAISIAECSALQIGPCACLITESLAPKQYVYTDAASACFEFASGQLRNVAPLMPLGSTVDSSLNAAPCQRTVENPTTVQACRRNQYCTAVDAENVQCLQTCQPGITVNYTCLCATPDGKTLKLAKLGDFCATSGAVTKKQPELCHPDTISAGNCKCSKDDTDVCPEESYCAAQNGKQTCFKTCMTGDDMPFNDCVCPFSGNNALVPADVVCACQNSALDTICTTAKKCEPNQIGPCGCVNGELDDPPQYMNSMVACVEFQGITHGMLVCKTNMIANQPCACRNAKIPAETPAKATAIDEGDACMRKPDGTTEIVQECALGTVSGSTCACRVSTDAGAASYCEIGSVCMKDPADAAKQVCWRLCSDANPCPNGSKCVGSGDNAHCEYVCAANCVKCPESASFCAECAKGYDLKNEQCVKSQALSIGAIVGIAVAAVVAAGGIAAGIFFAVRAMKTKKANAAKQSVVEPVGTHTVLTVAQ